MNNVIYLAFDLFSSYVQGLNKLKKLGMKVRYPPFPEHLSQGIVQLALSKYPEFKSIREAKVGDLEYFSEDKWKRIEVKAFSSDGPMSFGPKESWHKLVILDARDWSNDNFKCTCINLTNSCPEWRNLLVNKTETFEYQALKGRRPRFSPSSLLKQVSPYSSLLFEKSIRSLEERS